jgi:hypothetical protein
MGPQSCSPSARTLQVSAGSRSIRRAYERVTEFAADGGTPKRIRNALHQSHQESGFWAQSGTGKSKCVASGRTQPEFGAAAESSATEEPNRIKPKPDDESGPKATGTGTVEVSSRTTASLRNSTVQRESSFDALQKSAPAGTLPGPATISFITADAQGAAAEIRGSAAIPVRSLDVRTPIQWRQLQPERQRWWCWPRCRASRSMSVHALVRLRYGVDGQCSLQVQFGIVSRPPAKSEAWKLPAAPSGAAFERLG